MVDHNDARASAQKAQQSMGTKVIYHDGNGGMAEFSDAPHIIGQSTDRMTVAPPPSSPPSRWNDEIV